MKRPRKRTPYLWMSFADKEFLGVVILRAKDAVEGISKAWKMGINPGGQVLSSVMADEFDPPDEAVGRLLSKEDCNRLLTAALPTRIGDLPDDELRKIKEGVAMNPCHHEN